MHWGDNLFGMIIQFWLFAFLILGGGLLAVRYLRQPLERIRMIQIAMASLLLTAALSQIQWRPSIELPVLPTQTFAAEAVTTGTDVSKANAAFSPDQTPEVVGETMLGFDHKASTVIVDEEGSDYYELAAAAPSTQTIDVWQRAQQLFVFLFVGICALQLVYLMTGMWATRRLVRTADSLDAAAQARVASALESLLQQGDTEHQREVRVVTSQRVSVPMVNGLFRPTIVLPPHLVDGRADNLSLRHSLAHEWKHIERRDLTTWQLMSWLQALLWSQPFYWVLRRELRVSQDQIADEFAAQNTDQHVAYAETLVAFANSRQPVAMGALTMAGNRSNLYRRVEMLLNRKFHLHPSSRRRVVIGFASMMAAVGILLASLQLTEGANPANDTVASEAEAPVAEKDAAGKAQGDAGDEAQDDAGDKAQDDAGDKAQDDAGDKADGDASEKDKSKEAAEEKPAKESAEHSGYVLDAHSYGPIEGATVIVTRMNSTDWREVAVTESTTDEAGKFTFKIPPEQLKQKALYIMFDLRHPTYAARHCGSYSYSMIKKNLSLGAKPWFSKLYMVAGEKITGRLVDPEGAPVVGAALRANSKDPTAGEKTRGSSVKDVSGKDGRFEIILTAKGEGGLSIIPREQCMKHIDLGSKRGDLGDIVLEHGTKLKGQVLDAAGKPVPDVWVNLTRSPNERGPSYEMKRSSKTNASGEFQTRPVKPGKYQVEVELKATGALEKKRYANFHNDPPAAMFVRQTIEVNEASANQPFVIQAVPHVFISGQCYDSKGKDRAIHSPYLIGRLNDQTVWVREGRKMDRKGAFELMVPHGVENAQLHFTTNEHSALTVQFPGKSVSTQRHFRFSTIVEDLSDIKVTRYVAPILQVEVLDPNGKKVTDVRVRAEYDEEPPEVEGMMYMMSGSSYFEKQTGDVYRSSSLCPGVEFEVYAEKEGMKSERRKMTMKEGATDRITLTMKPTEADESEN